MLLTKSWIPCDSPLSRPRISLPCQSHDGFIHYLMESKTTIIPAPTEPSIITPYSTRRSLKPASWERLPIMDNRVQAVWNTLILSRISLNLSLALQLGRILDLEQLHQNLVNGSHVSSRCVNSRQISDDIMRDLNLVTNGDINPVQPPAFCFSFA